MKDWTTTERLLVLFAVWIFLGAKLPSFNIASQKPTAATYVYEKDQHAVPGPVMTALDKLNKQGLVATLHEIDTTDGAGEIPDQYKAVVPAAKEAGLPSLVVSAGEKVLRVIKAPTTEAAVMEAAR